MRTPTRSIVAMNKNTIRKFATTTLAAAFLAAPAIALAPAASATTPDPQPVTVDTIDPSLGIVAIVGDVSGEDLPAPNAFPCDQLDPSVRGPLVEGQENYCYLDRSGLARDGANWDDVTPATVPDLDPSLGIMPISIGINPVGPATDAANSGKWLSIGLSALAVGGTAVSLASRRRHVDVNA